MKFVFSKPLRIIGAKNVETIESVMLREPTGEDLNQLGEPSGIPTIINRAPDGSQEIRTDLVFRNRSAWIERATGLSSDCHKGMTGRDSNRIMLWLHNQVNGDEPQEGGAEKNSGAPSDSSSSISAGIQSE